MKLQKFFVAPDIIIDPEINEDGKVDFSMSRMNLGTQTLEVIARSTVDDINDIPPFVQGYLLAERKAAFETMEKSAKELSPPLVDEDMN